MPCGPTHIAKTDFLATEAHDDDGLPHTLEHLVFLGSEKYPFKVLNAILFYFNSIFMIQIIVILTSSKFCIFEITCELARTYF